MSIESEIRDQITAEFVPVFMELVNESHGHNVPAGSESHFKLVLVTEKFAHMSKVKRHQAVYAAVNHALQNGVHALALHTYTPDEWAARNDAPQSPACMGGSNKST